MRINNLLNFRAAIFFYAFFCYLVIWPALSWAKTELSSNYLPWSYDGVASQCPDIHSYLWVEHSLGAHCIRYFASTNLSHQQTVIIQFYGDRDLASRTPTDEIKNNTHRAQLSYAQRQSKRAADVPVVVMARPGTYGSSGYHKDKRSELEFRPIYHALDNLKSRYGIKNFILLGHSGGATVAAAMLTMGRDDILCAVMTSGTYDYLPRQAMRLMKRDRPLAFSKSIQRIAQGYDPYFHVDEIKADPQRKIYIAGNPKDKNTPFDLQVAFAWRIQAQGHHAEIVEVPTKAPSYHDMAGFKPLQLAASCAN